MIAKHHEGRWTKLISNWSPAISTRQEGYCGQNTLTRHIFSCFTTLISKSHMTLAQDVCPHNVIHASCAVFVLISLRLQFLHSSPSLSSSFSFSCSSSSSSSSIWVGSGRSTLCVSANQELGTLADNNRLTGIGGNNLNVLRENSDLTNDTTWLTTAQDVWKRDHPLSLPPSFHELRLCEQQTQTTNTTHDPDGHDNNSQTDNARNNSPLKGTLNLRVLGLLGTPVTPSAGEEHTEGLGKARALLVARAARPPVEAHNKQCGSCAGQFSPVVGVALLHARTRKESAGAALHSGSVRRMLKWKKGLRTAFEGHWIREDPPADIATRRRAESTGPLTQAA